MDYISNLSRFFASRPESSTQTSSTQPPAPASELLCSEYSSVDILAAFRSQVRHNSLNGDVVVNFSRCARDLRASTCPLCQLFGSVSWPPGSSFATVEARLIPIDLLFTGLTLPSLFETNAIGVHGYEPMRHRYHSLGLVDTRQPSCPVGFNYGVRVLNRESFDVEIVRHWIGFCGINHHGDCVPTYFTGISSFRVIDCVTKTVVKAPSSCRYVALSYVWGPSHLHHCSPEIGDPSLQNAPKVVTDSMKVVRLLGFRYLWIDRYCIHQFDSAEKHDQISRMDSIYASAQLTIIAAAGIGPDIGLPGVNGTLRRPQPSYQFGDYKVVSSLVTATVSLSETAWTSRGWTYQEGLLSRRRLIFTYDQVYFECNGMHCAEVLHLPLQEMLDTDTGKARVEVPPGAFTTKSIGDYPWRIMQSVSDFSARQLTYQSDALNAIQGIFRAFEKSPYPTYQLMGVPIMSSYIISGTSDPVVSTISRYPDEGFMIGLLWFHRHSRPEADLRRQCFPSWSWAGWNGQPEQYLEFNHRSQLSDLGVQVSVEDSDGSLLPFPMNDPSIPLFLDRLHDARFIHVTARTSKCKIIHKSFFTVPVEAGSRSSYMALLAGESRAVCLEFEPAYKNEADLSKSSLSGKNLTAIIFAPDTEVDDIDRQVSVLVVEEKGDLTERVGICLRPDVYDFRGVKSEPRLISNFLDISFSDHRHPYTAKDKDENRQAFKEWLDELTTRTIRIG
ncbi:hypothetical protein ONS96_008183 [Cadophora gregata f. sp. sojae]|nr:hypothetical protein ONS96_008183 [Cadophora gregata f. sp. sojae]